MFGFFFYKQTAAYELRISDWSSDVCSSDLLLAALLPRVEPDAVVRDLQLQVLPGHAQRDGDGCCLGVAANVRERLSRQQEEFEREIGRGSCRESVCQHG